MTVTGATAKSRRTRHIPLNREATLVLQGWREQSLTREGRVFVNDDGERFGQVNTAWRRLLKDAGITEFRWHDMRSEEHTSELQSLMRISYAVFCLTNKTTEHTAACTFSIQHTH